MVYRAACFDVHRDFGFLWNRGSNFYYELIGIINIEKFLLNNLKMENEARSSSMARDRRMKMEKVTRLKL